MKLDALLKKAIVTNQKLIKKHVSWKRTNAETGEELVDEFDVFVVANLNFSAQDRIIMGDPQQADATQMARAISERLRFGEEGEEKMSMTDAANLDPTLGWEFISLITQTIKELEPVKH
jgi:hypothetical protein